MSIRDEKYNLISRIEFSITAYSVGYEEKTYIFKDYKVIAKTERMHNVDSLMVKCLNDEIKKDEFISALKELRVMRWLRDYSPKNFDFSLCDTVLWHLKIYFSTERRPISIDGCNHFPPEFNSLLELFDIQIIKNVK